MDYNLLIHEIYWGYIPPTNHLLTSWDIQVGFFSPNFTSFLHISSIRRSCKHFSKPSFRRCSFQRHVWHGTTSGVIRWCFAIAVFAGKRRLWIAGKLTLLVHGKKLNWNSFYVAYVISIIFLRRHPQFSGDDDPTWGRKNRFFFDQLAAKKSKKTTN